MKYYIKDADSEFIVEELEDEEPTIEPAPEASPAEGLLPEEIEALKRLAAVAPQLIALLNPPAEEPVADEGEPSKKEEEEVLIDACDEDEDEDEEGKKGKSRDAFKSGFGSAESGKQSIDDSLEENDIDSAWAKRYGGNN